MKKKYDLFIFVGEASGEAHACEILEKLKALKPDLSLCGVTGTLMKKYAIDSLLSMDQFLVMGFLDVFLALPKIIKNFFYLRRKILQLNPKTCLFIDYPGFNLKLEASLRKKGFKGKIIHYICPSVWAWKSNRIKTMKKNLDALLCIYPFEKTFLQDQIKNTFYVGNPLLDKIKHFNYAKNWTLAQKSPLLGIFPGSREKEIQRNLPIQLEAAQSFFQTHPHGSIVISISDPKHQKFITTLINQQPLLELNKNLFFSPASDNYNLMKHLSYAIATSGTINLELALHHIPSIITYYIKPFDWFLAKNILKINLPYYCIVNILAKTMIFPELYGPTFTKENLLFYLNKLFSENSFKEKTIKNCQKLNQSFETYLQTPIEKIIG